MSLPLIGLSLLAACSTVDRPTGNSVALAACPDPPKFRSVAHGRGGNDQVFSGGASAQLFGDEDRDLIVGGSEIDEIIGGRDADVLLGAGSGDRFVFTGSTDSLADQTGGWSSATGDTLVDFDPGASDKIVLTGFAAPRRLRWSTRPAPFGIWAKATAADTFLFIDSSGDRRPDFAIRLLGRLSIDATALCA